MTTMDSGAKSHYRKGSAETIASRLSIIFIPYTVHFVMTATDFLINAAAFIIMRFFKFAISFDTVSKY